jgi:hypothetical protein
MRCALIAAVAFLAGCATKPTDMELSRGRTAIQPSSQTAAESAVVKYFENTLKDPESARYTFRPTINSWLASGSLRRFGWFMCGTVNAKNSYGGYTGQHMFLAYFEPSIADRVQEATIDSGRYVIVGDWCRAVYGY